MFHSSYNGFWLMGRNLPYEGPLGERAEVQVLAHARCKNL